MKQKLFVPGVLVLLLMGVTACAADKVDDNNSKQNINFENELTDEGIIKPEVAREIIEDIADQVILALGRRDTETIAEFVHPVQGLRFTPYTFVSIKEDKVFNQKEMRVFFQNQEVYVWGYYDGRGNEINLTPGEYYDEFVYTQDFKNAEQIGFNEVLSGGNMEENQFDVYNKPIIVEYYFSGFDSEYAGIDWRSLRLVFEQYKEEWKLVGIIHNQWTV